MLACEPPAREKSPKVIVVGAGVAGLRCAERLLEGGASVEILEARKRAGGRILNTPEGLPAGAAWVHGTEHNVVAERLERLGIRLHEVAAENPWMLPSPDAIAAFLPRLSADLPGQRASDATLMDAFTTLMEVVHAAANGADGDADLLGGLAHHAAATESTEVAELICVVKGGRQVSSRVSLMALIVHLIEVWMGATADDLSLAELEDYGVPGRLFGDSPGPHCLLETPGYLALVEDMQQAVTNRGGVIHYEEEVERIEVIHRAPESGVRISCNGSGGGSMFEADAAVVTVPLTLLRRLTFEPVLPDSKVTAMQTLDVGAYRKVLLFYEGAMPSAFPPEHFLAVPRPAVVLDDLGPWIVLDNLQSSLGVPAVAADLIGAHAMKMCGRPDEEVAAAVLSYVEGSLGPLPPPKLCRVTRWEEDPWSRGAYSFFPKGAGEDSIADLAAPCHWGRLAFAGEATHEEFQGAVPAAYISGERSAGEVLSILFEDGGAGASAANA